MTDIEGNAMAPAKRVSYANIETIDVGGARQHLRTFYENETAVVIVFHDSFEALSELASIFSCEKSVVIVITCSWYVSEYRAQYIRRCIASAIAVGNESITNASFLLVANSDLEFANMRRYIDGLTIARSNNCAFLDDEVFRQEVSASKVFDAVLNAKVNKFKRHELSSAVACKAFISYRTSETAAGSNSESSLMALKPRKIFWNLPQAGVVSALNMCSVGLMLSAEEGACYASAEYLLMGMPVVSTASVGGRDDFYSRETAVIVEADPDSVKAGVDLCLSRLENGDFLPEQIRAMTLNKMIMSRSALRDALEDKFRSLSVRPPENDIVTLNLRRASKFATTRNFWVKSFLVDPMT